ncbi:RidA family protein [Vulgatibacter incomptus]|uniref:Putative translation initiation inhibitor, yjgF family n=1 Tax=Vulgatibacter incomptus TaxID=1391653 RepID=A0A0K1PFR5_9BACT|nr:RidA family protein [Vulgatibacter incomptus]AKU92251.1 Putative translation initiation inhibitor, yjgF family [Vulgatibacter incomptus]
MGLLQAIQPPGWKRPKGYSNGIVGEGRILFVGGQIGWDADEVFHSDVFHEQWAQALSNVLDVVRAAGGGPEHVARMTIYVTDKQDYLAQLAEIGAAWKKHMGRVYPAMALVQVADLVEDRALVEIEATCLLPKEP